MNIKVRVMGCLLALVPAFFARGAERYDGVTRTVFYDAKADDADRYTFMAVKFDEKGIPVAMTLSADASLIKGGWQLHRAISIQFESGKAEPSRFKKIGDLTQLTSTSASDNLPTDLFQRRINGVLMFSVNGLASNSNVSWISWDGKSAMLKYLFAETVQPLTAVGNALVFKNVMSLRYSLKAEMPETILVDSMELPTTERSPR
jgi:hypothetical protein